MTPTHSSDETTHPDVDRASRQEPSLPPPMTRREAREQAAGRAHASKLAWAPEEHHDPRRPKKRRRWLKVTIVVVVILGLFGAGGVYVWNTFQPQVLKLIAAGQPTDYPGNGSGSVTVTIKDGDIGSDIASTLHKAGVVKTSSAFYSLLLKTKPDPVFQPGVYRLKQKMSAKAALSALQDPKNKLTRTAVIPEGTTEKGVLASLSTATKIPVADLQAAAVPSAFGLPPEAKTLEGFLFPATYTFDPGISAHDAIKTLVDRSFKALDDAGVPVADRWRIVTLASIVQAETGPTPGDMGKIARVFQNRLDQGMLLQSDATVKYGAGDSSGVLTSDAQRADASDPYNTYVHTGLPAGPIGNPGDEAIKSALNPPQGSWLYFVTVNLKTGETDFSTTLAEHDAAVQKLHDWCNASPANDEYCK